MINRIRNLWRLSEVNLPKSVEKPVLQQVKDAITGRKMASIVEMKKPLDMFPEENHDNPSQ